MRDLIFLATALMIAAEPALAKPVKDQQSPELKQCIRSCDKEADKTAQESCLVKCVKDDEARQKQKAGASTK